MAESDLANCEGEFEGEPMTLCIAAECRHFNESALVLCFDWRAQTGAGDSAALVIGTEDAYKLREIEHVSVLLAGHQSRAEELLAACTPAIRRFSETAFGPANSELVVDALLQELREAARAKKAEIVRHFVEMSIGISFDEFKKLPTSNYVEIWAEIRALTLGADLLISCAPPKSEPVIIRLDRWGTTHWETHYAAIGDGGEIARAMLCLQPWDDLGRHNGVGGGSEPPLAHCLYRVYEAKRAAHIANPSSVGRATGIQVLVEGGQKYGVTGQCFEALEEAFILKHNVPGSTPFDEHGKKLLAFNWSWISLNEGPHPWS